MRNILIGVFGGISLFSLVYIVYDIFIKEEKIIYQECNKDEICEECICDNEYENDEEPYEFHTSSVYVKSGEIYKLDVYKYLGSNVKIEDVILNSKKMKLENKDDILYVNDNKIGYAHALYITNDYIFVPTVAGQIGEVFNYVIDANGNITNLENNNTYGELQATNVYLKENGDFVVVGNTYCGIECTSDTEVVTFKNNNGKLEITKEKLK